MSKRLIDACSRGDLDEVNLLLRYESIRKTLDDRGEDGNTALDAACLNGHTAVYYALLEAPNRLCAADLANVPSDGLAAASLLLNDHAGCIQPSNLGDELRHTSMFGENLNDFIRLAEYAVENNVALMVLARIISHYIGLFLNKRKRINSPFQEVLAEHLEESLVTERLNILMAQESVSALLMCINKASRESESNHCLSPALAPLGLLRNAGFAIDRVAEFLGTRSQPSLLSLLVRIKDIKFDRLLRGACRTESVHLIRELQHPKYQIRFNSNYVLKSVLADAAQSGREDIVDMLLAIGADPKCKSQDGKTIIHFIPFGCNPQMIVKFVMLGVNVNDKAINDGMSALHYSCENNKPFMVRALLHRGANINAQDRYGMTPLHYCVNKTGKPGVFRELFAHETGPDIEIRDFSGRTSLSLACKSENEKGVEQMLSVGADVPAKNYTWEEICSNRRTQSTYFNSFFSSSFRRMVHKRSIRIGCNTFLQVWAAALVSLFAYKLSKNDLLGPKSIFAAFVLFTLSTLVSSLGSAAVPASHHNQGSRFRM